MDDRKGRPVVCSQRAHQFVIENDETNSYTEAESELSLECLCLLHCERLYSWRRIIQTIGVPSKIQKISQWNRWTSHQHSTHKSLRILRFCIVSWKDEREFSIKFGMGRQIDVFKSSQEYIVLDRIDGEPMKFEWSIFPGFTILQLNLKVQELLFRLSVTPEKFIGRIIFMSMFSDISWGSKDNKKECESNAQLVSLFAKRFGAGQWSFFGPGSETKVVFYQWR